MKMKIKNQLMMAVALLMAVGCAEDETPKTAEANAVEGLHNHHTLGRRHPNVGFRSFGYGVR